MNRIILALVIMIVVPIFAYYMSDSDAQSDSSIDLVVVMQQHSKCRGQIIFQASPDGIVDFHIAGVPQPNPGRTSMDLTIDDAGDMRDERLSFTFSGADNHQLYRLFYELGVDPNYVALRYYGRQCYGIACSTCMKEIYRCEQPVLAPTPIHFPDDPDSLYKWGWGSEVLETSL